MSPLPPPPPPSFSDGSARSAGSTALVEEALRLIESLQVVTGEHAAGHEHLDLRGASSDGTDGSTDAPAEENEAAAAECRVCPVCRLIAAFRQLRPEVVTHLVAAGEELLAAAREFAASGVAQASPTSPGSPNGGSPNGGSPNVGSDVGSDVGADRGTAPAPHRPAPRVPQRIELD